MTQNPNTQQVAAQQQANALPAQIAKVKDDITKSVLNKIANATKVGLVIPENYNAANNVTLALIELSESKEGKAPILQTCTPASVATALYKMCIMGLSLTKKQCDFIQYGNNVVCQPEYTGNIAMAKRLGHAGTPNAQVIYEDDVFEYYIDARGRAHVIKHEQALKNIDPNKIVGAWCAVPYADDPSAEPFVDVMTINEIHTSWQMGGSKGQSKAHRMFPAEMCKKTVISRACKLFIRASDDSDVAAQIVDDVDEQTAQIVEPANDVFNEANTVQPQFQPAAPAEQAPADERPLNPNPNPAAPVHFDPETGEEFPDAI